MDWAESNTTRFTMARNAWLPGVVEPGMFDNVMIHQLGGTYPSFIKRVWPTSDNKAREPNDG